MDNESAAPIGHLWLRQRFGVRAPSPYVRSYYDPALLSRAISYLYTKETRSSFASGGGTPSPDHASRFVVALRSADRFDPRSRSAVVALQNQIVDPRHAASGWRDFQDFVGKTIDLREQVHLICPRPEDVPDMMRGWSALTERMLSGTDPVVAASAFVSIHHSEDGNGRIHRYVVRHVLARTGFSPPGIIFPVSAAIVRDQRGYDEMPAGSPGPSATSSHSGTTTR